MGVPTLERPVPYKRIEIRQGATFSLGLLIVERDETGAVVVVDTAGWEAVLQVRPEPEQGSPVLLEASTANGRIVTGIQGTGEDQVNLDIKVPPTETAALTYFGDAGYDLLAIYPSGDRDFYLAGPAVLVPAYSWETP